VLKDPGKRTLRNRKPRGRAVALKSEAGKPSSLINYETQMYYRGIDRYKMDPDQYPSREAYIRAVELREQQEEMTKISKPIKQKIQEGFKKLAEHRDLTVQKETGGRRTQGGVRR
jgi:hypothetical protein